MEQPGIGEETLTILKLHKGLCHIPAPRGRGTWKGRSPKPTESLELILDRAGSHTNVAMVKATDYLGFTQIDAAELTVGRCISGRFTVPVSQLVRRYDAERALRMSHSM